MVASAIIAIRWTEGHQFSKYNGKEASASRVNHCNLPQKTNAAIPRRHMQRMNNVPSTDPSTFNRLYFGAFRSQAQRGDSLRANQRNNDCNLRLSATFPNYTLTDISLTTWWQRGYSSANCNHKKTRHEQRKSIITRAVRHWVAFFFPFFSFSFSCRDRPKITQRPSYLTKWRVTHKMADALKNKTLAFIKRNISQILNEYFKSFL